MNMIRIIIHAIIILLVMSVGCSCDQPTSPEAEQVLWQMPLTDEGLNNSYFPVAVCGEKVVACGMEQKSSCIYAVNRNDSKVVWQWKDPVKGRYLFMDRIYTKDNIMVVGDGPRNYGIDLETGKTLWRTSADRGGGTGVTGIGNLYFFPAFGRKVFAGNVQTGEEWEVFAYQDSANITRAGTNAPTIFVSPSGDTMLVTTNSLFRHSNNEVTPFLSLYNYTKRQLVYTVQLAEADMRNPVDGLPVIYKERVYVSVGQNIICSELWTGKQIWRTRFNHNFLFSGFIIAENKVIGNCEDRFMYALNPDTGQIIWQTQTSGTSSPPFYMNGVLYFTGGGDGRFHAIEAATGKYIWKLRSPDLSKRSGAWFRGPLAGSDGKVYVMSYLSLFCYKAAR